MDVDIGTADPATTLDSEPRRQQLARIRADLHDLGAQLRQDLDTADRPRLRTLARTTADLLDTLARAFAEMDLHGGDEVDPTLT